MLAAIARGRQSNLVRQGVANLGTNVGQLTIALGTGTLLARTLGASGRGQLAAVMIAPPFIAAIAETGCIQAITYEHARDPMAHRWLLSTWLLMLLPAVIVAIVVGELLIRVILADQGAQVQWLASIYMPIIAFLVVGDISLSVLVGDSRFKLYNLQRVLQPLGTLVGYIILRIIGRLDVASAMSIVYATTGLGTIVVFVMTVRRYGIGRPRWSKGRGSLWYGFRAHGANVSLLVNGRLDQFLLPAFVAASSLGLYAVAVSVSGLVFYLAAPLAVLVLPAAARRRRDQPDIVRRATQATFLIALSVGIVLAFVAKAAVALVYGRQFTASIGLIWLLIPGSVVYVAGYTLWQGLYAAGKPVSSVVAQGAGFAVTVIGLFIWLPRGGGIVAAAIVSTVAYGVVMLCSLALYCRASGLAPREFISVRAFRRPVLAMEVGSGQTVEPLLPTQPPE